MAGIRMMALIGAAAFLVGCGPKATVTQSTPMAQLETYGSVLVRVGSNPNLPDTQQHVAGLEYVTADRLRRKCRFQQVMLASQQPQGRPDLIMDLSIQRLFMGADPNEGGLIKFHSSSQATADVSVVLSDGINDELVGSAQIRGKSSAVTTSSPQAQAVTVVADKLADMMKSSGCHLDRVARAPEAPVKPPADPKPPTDGGETGTPGDPPAADPNKDKLAEASSLNDEGKALFRQGNAAGAATKFQSAVDLAGDPRYLFNLCLAREAEGRLDDALAACKRVTIANGAQERLTNKATQRIKIINEKRGS